MWVRTSTMLSLLTLLILQLFRTHASSSSRRRKQQFIFRDCGIHEERPMRVLNVTLRPDPLRTPGKLKLWVSVNVTRDLPPNISADVIVTKYFMGIPFKIPCFKKMGTCHYTDVCGMLTGLTSVHGCPRKLKRDGIPCGCPVSTGLYTLQSMRLMMPTLEGIASFALGHYEAMIRVYESHTKAELGCARVEFHLRKRKKKKRDKYGMRHNSYNGDFGNGNVNDIEHLYP